MYRRRWNRAYRDFLLSQYHGAVLPPHSDGGNVCGCNSLECIFYMRDGFVAVSFCLMGVQGASQGKQHNPTLIKLCRQRMSKRTDLIQTTLIREDCDMSIVACASCPREWDHVSAVDEVMGCFEAGDRREAYRTCLRVCPEGNTRKYNKGSKRRE